MEIINTPIEGLYIIKPRVFSDDRGHFYESFNHKIFHELTGVNIMQFLQDNESKSKNNVLRGLHFQKWPYEQSKLVRVIKGKVLDVVVDIRRDSSTFGQHFSIELSEDNKLQLFIPIGFAHGFRSLEDDTIFSYKCSYYYNKRSEDGLDPFDKDLGIKWGVVPPTPLILSEKDSELQSWEEFKNK